MNSKSLVIGINIATIGALTPLKNRFPIFRSILNKSQRPFDDWRFFMTIAGVGSYLLRNSISKEKQEEIVGQLTELDKQMPEALNNFFDFRKDNKDEYIDMTAVGFWVLWSIGGEAPTLEESRELAPVIGNYLSNVIKDFES